MKTIHWILILAVFLLLSLTLLLLPFWSLTESSVAQIYRNGQLLHTIDLSRVETPYTLSLSQDGQENVILVEPDTLSVQSANCPDKLCVHQGHLKSSRAPIVCLPHRIVIQLVEDPSDQPDAIVQ